MKPQDILVVLKLLTSGWPGSYAALSQQLGLSASETHAALRRAQQSSLIHPDGKKLNKSALEEFLLHGIKYIFPVQPGPSSRGMPTSYAAPPLAKEFFTPSNPSSDVNIPVWPDQDGEHRGYEFKPLCRSVPKAARNDPKLYEWLALADALRGGRGREKELAARIVRQRLGYETNS